MARVLILSLVFAPDGASTAQIMSELAIDLRNAGHCVSVVTTAPHMNRDRLAESVQPLRRRWFGLFAESEFDGISVRHTWMPPRAKSKARRLLGWGSFHLLGGVAVLLGERPDVIIVPSPLLTVGWLAWLVGALRGSRYI